MDTNEANVINKVSSSTTTNSDNATSKTVRSDKGQLVSTTRLTSFRVPRDLTLGGNIKSEKVKKVYTPNLNVQRKKKGDTDVPTVKSEKSTDNRQKNVRDVKGKKPNNLIQSVGIFSQGLSESTKKKFDRINYPRESSNDKSDAGTSLEKPKLNTIPTINKAEEDEKLRILLRDDFIDDDKKEVTSDNVPITLPLKNPKNIYNDHNAILLRKFEHKKETDVKPTIMGNGEVKRSPTKVSKIKYEEEITPVLDVLENKSNSNYIFMQFPSCLPILRSDDENAINGSTKKDTTSRTTENVNKNTSSDCGLNDLKEGCIGKLQILRSGKAKMILGGHEFDIEKGTNPSYRQDLVAIKLDKEQNNGDVINLGPVNHTLIVSVDMESLLNET